MMRALLCLALAGCVVPPPPEAPQEWATVHLFPDSVDREDILFVIDDSPSMATVRSQLDTRLGSPLSFSLGTQVDWHIGVTNGSSAGTLPNTPCNLSPFLAMRATVTDVGQVATSLACMAGQTQSSAPQQPLAAALAALDTPGFVRDDAGLTIFIITNGDDTTSPDGVITGIFNRKTFRGDVWFVLVAGPPSGCADAAPATRLSTLLKPQVSPISFCDDWYLPVVFRDAGYSCVPPLADAANPDCSVMDLPGGNWRDGRPVPACTTYGPRPCWRIDDTRGCTHIAVDRGGVDPPHGTYAIAECVIAF
jgi:hypothetical protein